MKEEPTHAPQRGAELLAKLRSMVEPMPSGSSILLPTDWLREMLEQEPGPVRDEPLGDLTLEEVAKAAGRSPSTVRGWLGAGLIPQAYKLRGRDWRVPREGLRLFLERERTRKEIPAPTRKSEQVDLGAWRKVYRKPS